MSRVFKGANLVSQGSMDTVSSEWKIPRLSVEKNENFSWKMEVAGIEPASEDPSIAASTCLAQILKFAYHTPTVQGS